MTTLIVFAGLPGVGKTTIARKLARALGGTCYLRVDEIETAIIDGDPMLEPGPEGYRVAAALSVSNLVLGTDVIVDSVNPLTVTRQMFTDAAQHAKAKQAQAEYERLQHHFAQIQQRNRLKGPTWQCLSLAVAAPQGTSRWLWAIRHSQGESLGHKRPATASKSPPPSDVSIRLRLALQGAGAAGAAGSVGCGRGAAGGAATAAAGPRGVGEHCARSRTSPPSQPLMGSHLSYHCAPHASYTAAAKVAATASGTTTALAAAALVASLKQRVCGPN